MQEGRIDIGAHESELSLASILTSIFGEDETAGETVTALLAADQDGDGRDTTTEIATGSNPAVADRPRGVKPILGSLIVEFQLNERLRDFTYTVEGSGDLSVWQPGASFHPQGDGAGYLRTPGTGSEFISATRDGPIWTIRERIVAPAADEPPALFGRLVFDVDLTGIAQP